MKVILVIALLGVIAALASAGLMMLKRPKDQTPGAPADARMAKALAVRVGLSVTLFLLLLLAWQLGWITPQGVPLVKG